MASNVIGASDYCRCFDRLSKGSSGAYWTRPSDRSADLSIPRHALDTGDKGISVIPLGLW